MRARSNCLCEKRTARRLETVRSPLHAAFFQRRRRLQVAAHTEVSGYARPQYSSTTAGKNQKPPHHPHNALAYQNEAASAETERHISRFASSFPLSVTLHPDRKWFGVSLCAKGDPGEASLQQRHQSRVPIADHEQNQKWNRDVILIVHGVVHGDSEIATDQ